jgi:hypothetical protein
LDLKPEFKSLNPEAKVKGVAFKSKKAGRPRKIKRPVRPKSKTDDKEKVAEKISNDIKETVGLIA